jgi:ribosome-binding factor A
MINDANDPSFKQVSIIEVKPSPDLKKAVVYFSAFGDLDQILPRLNKAKGFLRKNLADRLYVKFVPDLIFEADQPLSKNEKK